MSETITNERVRASHTGLWLAFGAAVVSGIAVFINAYGVRAVPDPTVYTTAKNLIAATVLIGLLGINRWGRRVPPPARTSPAPTSPAPTSPAPTSPAPTSPARLPPASVAGLVSIAVIGGSIPFVLFFEGLARASSSQTAFIHKTLVIWVALLAVPLLAERLGPLHIAAIATLVVGQAILAGGVGKLRFDAGEWLVLAATLLWSVEVVLARRLLRGVPPDVLGAARMGGGVVLLLGWVAVSGRWHFLAALGATGWAWAALTGLVLAGYVALWFSALALAPAVDVTAILVVAAVITSGLNVVVKGAAIDNVTGIGLLTVVAGTALAALASRRRTAIRAVRA